MAFTISIGNAKRAASRQSIAIIGTVTLHLLVFWMLGQGLITKFHRALPMQDVRAVIIQTITLAPKLDLPRPAIQLKTIPSDSTSPPDFVIEQTPLPTSVMLVETSAPTSRIVPPLPDSNHPNPSPYIPSSFSHDIQNSKVTLSILVMPDGTIGETRIAKSSGSPALDTLAAKFAIAHWRFRPATLNSEPVKDWTTVIVDFAPRSADQQ